MTLPLSEDRRIIWNESEREAVWIDDAVDATSAILQTALDSRQGPIRMLVSGGSTPEPVYRRLAGVDLDWSRIRIGLVDDRDVSASDHGSNARAVRRQLLHGKASKAGFQPLRETAETLAQAVEIANRVWNESAVQPIAVALLGMGEDGHTASLFPDARDLDSALAARQAYVQVDATGCAVAGDYPRRISLTPFGLAQARQRLLLIRGNAKRDALVKALADGSVAEMPIRATWQPTLAPLHVHWCSNG